MAHKVLLTLTLLTFIALFGAVGFCRGVHEPSSLWADDEGHDYSEQQHQGATTPADGLDGCVVAELESGCVMVPAAMFRGIKAVSACESGGWWSKAATPGHLVSPNGLYYGSLQLDKRHGVAMAAAGLDWESDADRLRWGVRLWERWGWSLWPHCGKLG